MDLLSGVIARRRWFEHATVVGPIFAQRPSFLWAHVRSRRRGETMCWLGSHLSPQQQWQLTCTCVDHRRTASSRVKARHYYCESDSREGEETDIVRSQFSRGGSPSAKCTGLRSAKRSVIVRRTALAPQRSPQDISICCGEWLE